MEKKKLLLVAVSVGVVLLIIIGIPLLLISPRQVTAPTVHPVRDITHIDPFARPVQPHTQPVQPAQHIQREDFEQRLAPVPEPARETPVPAPPPVAREEGPRVVTTITIPAPRTAAVPDAPAAPATARPAPARPAPAAQARPAQPQPARPAAAARPVAPAVPTRNNFWVQTGAFSSKARAETVKESLEAKGIASII